MCFIPGKLLPARVGTNGPIPGRTFTMVPPVSVCHQVSMIGQRECPIFLKYQFQASLSIGSPTDPRIFREGILYFFMYFSGNFMNILIAVGAV